jgi:hypothetical protein
MAQPLSKLSYTECVARHPPVRSRELILRKQILKLKRLLGKQNPGSGFFQGCLAKSRGSTSQAQESWRRGVYNQIRRVMPLQGHLSVERMCVGPGKPGQFLSPLAAWMVDSASMALRLQTGYCELRAQGMSANHKRIARIMRDDNLLAARQHWFRRPEHSFRAARVHLNLAARMTLSGPNQL